MPFSCDCGTAFDLTAALDHLAPDRMGSSRMFVPDCTGCGRSLELRLNNGSFEVGYSYFGGSMHFEPVKKVSVKGLRVTPVDPDDLVVVLGERTWHFGIRHLSHQQFCILPQAAANGRRVDELDFAQWDVSLTGILRNREPIEFGPDTMVLAGDFLILAGPSPALTRAWHYLNDGRSRQP